MRSWAAALVWGGAGRGGVPGDDLVKDVGNDERAEDERGEQSPGQPAQLRQPQRRCPHRSHRRSATTYVTRHCVI